MKQRGESQIEERNVIKLATRDQSNVISHKQNNLNTIIALWQLLGINTVRLNEPKSALHQINHLLEHSPLPRLHLLVQSQK